jgi:hypothetical protein
MITMVQIERAKSEIKSLERAYRQADHDGDYMACERIAREIIELQQIWTEYVGVAK